jgi:hypothetical protein
MVSSLWGSFELKEEYHWRWDGATRIRWWGLAVGFTIQKSSLTCQPCARTVRSCFTFPLSRLSQSPREVPGAFVRLSFTWQTKCPVFCHDAEWKSNPLPKSCASTECMAASSWNSKTASVRSIRCPFYVPFCHRPSNSKSQRMTRNPQRSLRTLPTFEQYRTVRCFVIAYPLQGDRRDTHTES